MIEIAGVWHQKPILPVGTKIKFASEKQRYTVRSSNAAYTICTKPFNAQKTVLYTIIDFHENVRGPEDLIFGLGAETDEEIAAMQDRMTNGDSEVSHRHRCELDIESVDFLDNQLTKERE
jgi:hypothetical protein